MYNIYNASEVFYLYDIRKEKMSLIGDENDLINMIAAAYTSWWDWGSPKDYCNTYLDEFACSQGDVTAFTRWQFFDGFNRVINPKIYEKQAHALWVKKYKTKQDKRDYRYWNKNKTYKGVFRQTPVSDLIRHHGGPYCKKPIHIAHIWRDWGNPEYDGFRRGYCPDKWYEGGARHNERNWKSQRKHQWKEKKEIIDM